VARAREVSSRGYGPALAVGGEVRAARQRRTLRQHAHVDVLVRERDTPCRRARPAQRDLAGAVDAVVPDALEGKDAGPSRLLEESRLPHLDPGGGRLEEVHPRRRADPARRRGVARVVVRVVEAPSGKDAEVMQELDSRRVRAASQVVGGVRVFRQVIERVDSAAEGGVEAELEAALVGDGQGTRAGPQGADGLARLEARAPGAARETDV